MNFGLSQIMDTWSASAELNTEDFMEAAARELSGAPSTPVVDERGSMA